MRRGEGKEASKGGDDKGRDGTRRGRRREGGPASALPQPADTAMAVAAAVVAAAAAAGGAGGLPFGTQVGVYRLLGGKREV